VCLFLLSCASTKQEYPDHKIRIAIKNLGETTGRNYSDVLGASEIDVFTNAIHYGQTLSIDQVTGQFTMIDFENHIIIRGRFFATMFYGLIIKEYREITIEEYEQNGFPRE
jgi:hypothetical protein